jgi:hypothetical protein
MPMCEDTILHQPNDHPIAVFAPPLPMTLGNRLSALLAVLRGYRPLDRGWMTQMAIQTLMSAILIIEQKMHIECGYLLHEAPNDPIVHAYSQQWELMHTIIQEHPWTHADRAGLGHDYDGYRETFFDTIAWCISQPPAKIWDTELDWATLRNLLAMRDLLTYLGPMRFATPDHWACEAVMLNVAMLLAIPAAFIADLPSWATPQGRYQSIINPPFWWHFREGYGSDEWSHW